MHNSCTNCCMFFFFSFLSFLKRFKRRRKKKMKKNNNKLLHIPALSLDISLQLHTHIQKFTSSSLSSSSFYIQINIREMDKRISIIQTAMRELMLICKNVLGKRRIFITLLCALYVRLCGWIQINHDFE